MTAPLPWCLVQVHAGTNRGAPQRTAKEDMAEYEETLRRLALDDESFVESVLGMGRDTVEVSRLDPKTHALVRLAASLAIDAAPSSYQSNAERALAAGADIDEIVGTLIAVAPTVGLTRVISARLNCAGARLRRGGSPRSTRGGRSVDAPPYRGALLTGRRRSLRRPGRAARAHRRGSRPRPGPPREDAPSTASSGRRKGVEMNDKDRTALAGGQTGSSDTRSGEEQQQPRYS